MTSSGPGRGTSASAARLRVPTLGDYLHRVSPESQSFSISSKDRAAVLMGGKSADVALWWDTNAGGFISSTVYAGSLPDFVQDWNEDWLDIARGWHTRTEGPRRAPAPAGELTAAQLRRV